MNATPTHLPEYERRFAFHAHAAAFGGHIIRPKDIVIEAHGASALPPTGGRSVASIQRVRFDEYFGVDAASTFAEGLFENHDRFREYTLHHASQDSLVARTTAWAEVTNLFAMRTPRLTIGRLRAELGARSPFASGQPAIELGKLAIDDVRIDGKYHLVVELDSAPFRGLDTHAKLLAAADDPAFVKTGGKALQLQRLRPGETSVPVTGRVIECLPGTVYTTVVKAIHWDGNAFPGSAIEQNYVVIPEFGRVYFGELLISSLSRRLTMVRMDMGSDGGGVAAAADVQDNGGWSWP